MLRKAQKVAATVNCFALKFPKLPEVQKIFSLLLYRLSYLPSTVISSTIVRTFTVLVFMSEDCGGDFLPDFLPNRSVA